MSQYSGPQGSGEPKDGRMNKGVAKARRAIKRAEAEERNTRTSENRTRQEIKNQNYPKGN